MEKRYFTRVEFKGGASLKSEKQEFPGDIQNICLHGLFVKTSYPVKLNDSLLVSVPFSIDSSLKLNTNVVRCESDGIGLKIVKMDVNSFVKLRNAIVTKCNDHGRIMRETYKVTNCIY